jgi:mannose-6-phosphate isomerase-like protein (cupin superfamily)
MRWFLPLMVLLMNCPFQGIPQNLDGSFYNPATEPDIDMFISSWKESVPALSHGTLIERAVFTKGLNPDPTRKGAVLEYINRFSYATLPIRAVTTPTVLNNEQEILYILSGSGTIQSAGETFHLSPGMAVLIPANLSFSMSNNGETDMTMYLLAEPIPKGFRPNKQLLIRNEGSVPFSGNIVHWSHMDTFLFKTEDGLGTLELVETCTFGPMTIGHPHSHGEGTEEVWSVISGDNIVMLGKQIRRQPVGTSYLIPNDGKTPHSNINVTDELLKFFYFARYGDHAVRP